MENGRAIATPMIMEPKKVQFMPSLLYTIVALPDFISKTLTSGKGRKCKLRCDEGYVAWSLKQNKPYSDGVVKCKSDKGWKKKPKKVECRKK